MYTGKKRMLTFLLSLLILDAIAIKLWMQPLYQGAFGVSRVSLVYAALAYLAMASSWGLIRGDPKKAALAGFAIYGTYAFTLKALFPQYTVTMMASEVAWGVTLMTLATLISRGLSRG
jgi:uncharacterized membrane protein